MVRWTSAGCWSTVTACRVSCKSSGSHYCTYYVHLVFVGWWSYPSRVRNNSETVPGKICVSCAPTALHMCIAPMETDGYNRLEYIYWLPMLMAMPHSFTFDLICGLCLIRCARLSEPTCSELVQVCMYTWTSCCHSHLPNEPYTSRWSLTHMCMAVVYRH